MGYLLVIDLEKLRLWLQILIPAAALAGAVLIAVWQQSRVDRRVNEERERKHLASRSTLPISLANLNHYAEDCISSIVEIYPLSSEGTYFASTLKLPNLPEDVIKSLKECIETSDARVARELASLIQFSQIQNSRMIGVFRKTASDLYVSKHSFDQVLFDVAKLWLLVEKFYEYGRLREEQIDTKLSAEDMHRAARVLGLERLESFMDYVGLRKDSITN